MKSNGPKTPHDEVGNISEKQFPILIAFLLSVRYEENQHGALSDMHADSVARRRSGTQIKCRNFAMINVKANIIMY